MNNPGKGWWSQVRGWDWETVALLLGVKAMLLYLGVQVFTARDRPYPGVLEVWTRWDAVHYLRLAEQGYQAIGEARASLVFYPLYPWLVRAAHFVLRDYLLAAFVVSGLALFAAAMLLRHLAALDESPAVARRAVWFLAIFPTAYFLHIAYTESLFLACTLGALLAARRNRWLLAGALGAAATLTRVNGLLLLPVLAAEAFLQGRAAGRFSWCWLWIALVPAGFLVYLGVNYRVAGNAFAFSPIMEEVWFKKLTPPWIGIAEVWDRIDEVNSIEGTQEFLYILLTLGCTIWCWFRLRLSYSVWMTGNWLLFTSTSFVLSVPRYALTLFPIFLLLARAANGRRLVGQLLSVVSLLLMAFYATRFAVGLWAF